MIIEQTSVVELCACAKCRTVGRCVVYRTYTSAQHLDGPTVEHAEARVTAYVAICRQCTERQLAAFRGGPPKPKKPLRPPHKPIT